MVEKTYQNLNRSDIRAKVKQKKITQTFSNKEWKEKIQEIKKMKNIRKQKIKDKNERNEKLNRIRIF